MGFDTTVVTFDTSIRILDVAIPLELHDPVHNMTIASTIDGQFAEDYSLYSIGPMLFDSNGLTFVYTDPVVGAVYTTKAYAQSSLTEAPPRVPSVDIPNGFYFRRKDGTLATYRLKIPFISANRTVPDITWNDGTKNTSEFTFQSIGGCGASDYLSILPVTDAELIPVGIGTGGVVIDTFKDTNNAYLKEHYDYAYKGPNDEMTYADFLAKHPMFLWKDPLGRWIAFSNRSIGPQAECGKPVIYLYPTKAENVSVKLAPVGGFTKTEPAYGNGWNVFAQPNGVLTNLADKLTYPYLFWEGSGGAYQTPDKGWSVARADVHSFLVSKLATLGLNQKETADFLEFWEPRMQGSPYYFITFLGNQAMN